MCSNDKLEIFAALILKHNLVGSDFQRDSQTEEVLPKVPGSPELSNSTIEKLNRLANQLPASSAQILRTILIRHEQKPKTEQQHWCDKVLMRVLDCNESMVSNIHQSQLDYVLQKETIKIQRIINKYLNKFITQPAEIFSKPAIDILPETKSRTKFNIEKEIFLKFAEQFVFFEELPEKNEFDQLNCLQIIRLIHLLGIREVAFSCLQTKSIEQVSIILKLFMIEDALMINMQLKQLLENNLSKDRLFLAESIVEKTIIENVHLSPIPPSLIGIQLLAIYLDDFPDERRRYAKQKLPIILSNKIQRLSDSRTFKAVSPEVRKEIEIEIEEFTQKVLQDSLSNSQIDLSKHFYQPTGLSHKKSDG